ncbi:hypothetical protein H632_c3322p0, partial [Helicosporidium sp. ATCC 50920]
LPPPRARPAVLAAAEPVGGAAPGRDRGAPLLRGRPRAAVGLCAPALGGEAGAARERLGLGQGGGEALLGGHQAAGHGPEDRVAPGHEGAARQDAVAPRAHAADADGGGCVPAGADAGVCGRAVYGVSAARGAQALSQHASQHVRGQAAARGGAQARRHGPPGNREILAGHGDGDGRRHDRGSHRRDAHLCRRAVSLHAARARGRAREQLGAAALRAALQRRAHAGQLGARAAGLALPLRGHPALRHRRLLARAPARAPAAHQRRRPGDSGGGPRHADRGRAAGRLPSPRHARALWRGRGVLHARAAGGLAGLEPASLAAQLAAPPVPRLHRDPAHGSRAFGGRGHAAGHAVGAAGRGGGRRGAVRHARGGRGRDERQRAPAGAAGARGGDDSRGGRGRERRHGRGPVSHDPGPARPRLHSRRKSHHARRGRHRGRRR